MAEGEVQFVVTIPENFGRMLVRGERPALLIEADASDQAQQAMRLQRWPESFVLRSPVISRARCGLLFLLLTLSTSGYTGDIIPRHYIL